MKQILLLGADIDSPNNGVNALTLGTLAALVKRYPDGFCIDIINIGGNSEYETQVEIDGALISIKKHRPHVNLLTRTIIIGYLFKLLSSLKFDRWFAQGNKLANLIHSAEIVIDLSEGDSFSDIYGNVRFFVHFLYKLLPVIGSAPLFLLPQTIGP